MTRSRRTALLLLLLPLLALAGSGAASAQTVTGVDDVVAGLRAERVFLAADSEVPLDEAAVESAARSAPVQVYIAAVSAATADRAGGLPSLVNEIGTDLGDPSSVVLVFSDAPDVYADQATALGNRGINAGEAARQASGQGEFTEANITSYVQVFVATLDQQAAGGSGSGSPGGGSALSLWPVLLLGGLGVGGYALVKGRHSSASRARELQDSRADVESLYGRLGSDVQLLAPGDDAVARQALADASERYTATGALMAKADTPGEYAAARRTAVEGITAARVVRSRLGLDPGPDVPLPEGQGPRLTEETRVQVGEEQFDGSPTYQPGRPHYYEGGYYGGSAIPGGWYATPFWQTLLIGSMMSGGLGGGRRRGHGRGYGGGFGGFGGGGGGFGGVFGGGRRGGGGFGGFGGGGWGGGGGGGRRGGGGW